jgi:repressor LexA
MKMHVGEKIKKLRKENNLTQNQLAKKLNIAPTAVSAWERGSNRPLIDKLTIMSEIFNVPLQHFFDVEEEESDQIQLPIYGNISCGNGELIYEPTSSYEATPKSWTTGGEYFYLKAKGDSMIGANIQEGDLLFIRKQSEVENGEIAVVAIDDQVVLKRAYRNNGTFTLVSENPAYPPRIFDPKSDKNIMIIGKLKRAITTF